MGALMHLLHWPLTGFFMYAIGLVCMFWAYLYSESFKAVVLSGLVAAAIKCSGFLLPSMMVIRVVNPVISILLETILSVAVFALLVHYKKASAGWLIVGVVVANSLWRFAYLVCQFAGEWLFHENQTIYNEGTLALLKFLLFSNIISSLIAIVLIQPTVRLVAQTVVKPAYACGLALLGCLCTLFL